MPQEEKSIIRSLLDPTIALDEMSYKDIEEGTNNGYTERGDKESKNVGNNFPLIIINDYTVSEDETERMTIDSTGKVPTIALTMNLQDQSTFLSKSMPKDGDRINLFIRARNDAFKPVRNDYLITSVDTSKSQTESGDGMVVNLSGELFIPGFRDEAIRSKQGTTYDVLFEIAEDLGLGFATNEDATEDEQIWICANEGYRNYLNHICDAAWKNEESFYEWYIDIYYHLNFVNINNQFSNSTEIDDALLDTLLSDDTKQGEEISTATDKKLFTNIQDKRGTPMFIKRYKLVNESSEISNVLGYKMHCEFFEQNSLQKWDLYAEPMIVPGSEEDKILLKGRAGEDYYRTQIKRRWSGVQYSLPEHNVHEKYLFSRIHNLMNFGEIGKMQVHIEVPRANFNIYRGERIPCIFIATGDPIKSNLLQQEAEKEAGGEDPNFAVPGAPTLDKFYTGFYMIRGMIFSYETANPQDPENRGHFTEDVILARREWPTP